MKFYDFIILIITLCLSLVYAAEQEWYFGSDGKLYVEDLGFFQGEYHFNNCRFNQSRMKIYCDFKDSKYRNKKLYLMIPVTLEKSHFYHDDVIKSYDVYGVYTDGSVYSKGYHLAYTSDYEIIEAGDTYYCGGDMWSYYRSCYFNMKLKSGRELRLNFTKIYVNRY